MLDTFGNVLFIIGMTYDTVIDRDGHTLVRWRFRHLWNRGEDKEFRPGRKMIFNLEEMPEGTIKDD